MSPELFCIDCWAPVTADHPTPPTCSTHRWVVPSTWMRATYNHSPIQLTGLAAERAAEIVNRRA